MLLVVEKLFQERIFFFVGINYVYDKKIQDLDGRDLFYFLKNHIDKVKFMLYYFDK